MPGFPVHHQLLEFAQTHVHWVGDTIQPSHPLSSTSPPALNLSQNRGLFQWVSSYIRWPKYWSFSFSISPCNESLCMDVSIRKARGKVRHITYKYWICICANIILLISRRVCCLKKLRLWASPVAPWWRIHGPMQETWVPALVQKDPTCPWVTQPMCPWACVLDPGSHNFWSPWMLESVLYNKGSHLNEQPTPRN